MSFFYQSFIRYRHQVIIAAAFQNDINPAVSTHNETRPNMVQRQKIMHLSNLPPPTTRSHAPSGLCTSSLHIPKPCTFAPYTCLHWDSLSVSLISVYDSRHNDVSYRHLSSLPHDSVSQPSFPLRVLLVDERVDNSSSDGGSDNLATFGTYQWRGIIPQLESGHCSCFKGGACGCVDDVCGRVGFVAF